MNSEPWYLTVVRTHGVLFLRPEKSWRPIVSVSLGGTEHVHETLLGCDGQNPNMKHPLILHDVDHDTRLDIKVWHKGQTKKQRRKRHLVGSAYVVLGELLRRQEQPGADVTLNLKCPPPQKKSPTIGGSRQANCATLTVRVKAPPPPPVPDSAATLVGSGPPSVNSDNEAYSGLSDADSAVLLAEEPPREVLQGAEAAPDDILPDSQLPTLRKRRKHRKLKPYIIDSCDEDAGSSSDSSCPPTPPAHDDYFSHSYDADQEVSYEVTEDGAKYTIVRHQNTHEPCVPSILPQYAADKPEDERELSLVEAFVDLFAPYREMSHPQCDYGKVLSRLLTEWYAIGASLLATATLNAAVYGYSAGTLFDVDGLALRSVTLGSIASGIGLVADVWFLVVYSGADVAKFQRLALDVYHTHFFFCLTCRLPTLCLFAAVCALLVFLLAVAWSAWSAAVLVMCCAAGVLLTLQYLVYGAHRMLNLAVWAAWRVAHAVRRVFVRAPVPAPVQGPAAGSGAAEGVGSGARDS